MRVIIAGSRGIQDYNLLERVIAESGLAITLVISGDARGVDRLGALWADRDGIPVEKHPAKWATYGAGAGNRRNGVMANRGDALIALWDGSSPGTLDMIRKAKDAGLAYCIYNLETQRYSKSTDL